MRPDFARRGPSTLVKALGAIFVCAVVLVAYLHTSPSTSPFRTASPPSTPSHPNGEDNAPNVENEPSPNLEPGLDEEPTTATTTTTGPHPIYKPTQPPKPLVTEHFPRAATARSPSDLPPIPSWNAPPSPHVNESTPLFIGFTRNWELLQQNVVSYLTAGWPAEDIYVVENTGTMKANRNGNLTLQNPFYLDYRRLTEVFGVNVLSTPTLFSFAQLQNYYLHLASENGWDHFFWSHMDVVVMSNETWLEADGTYKSLYMRAVDDIRRTRENSANPIYEEETDLVNGWAQRFYAYDTLTLVNCSAFESVGGWDTMIPYYGTDCDMYFRLNKAGFKQGVKDLGLVYDVASILDDVEVLYRRQESTDRQPDLATSNLYRSVGAIPPADTRGSAAFTNLTETLHNMQWTKKHVGERNRWQTMQEGGQGEPFYRDAAGFDKAIHMWSDHSMKILSEKWGHRECNLGNRGLKLEDAWRVKHDWK